MEGIYTVNRADRTEENGNIWKRGSAAGGGDKLGLD